MLIDVLKQKLGGDVLHAETAHRDDVIVVARDRTPEVMRKLRDDPEFDFAMLVDVTALDWPERTPRFDVVYHLNSLAKNHRLRVKVQVGNTAGDDAWVHTLTSIWKSADWLERECFDLFGIEFRGHPDLRRILLYDSFKGHPLRKDYPYNHRQPVVEEVDPVTHPRHSSR